MYIRHVLPQPVMGALPYDPVHSAMTGVVNAAWHLAVQQVAAGHEVEIVAPGERPKLEYRNIAGVRIYWLPRWQTFSYSRYDFSYLLPLMLFTLRSRMVDVVHVHSNPFFLLRSRSRARVLHYQNSPIKGSQRYDRAVGRADTVICCSDFIRQQLMEMVPYPPSNIRVVYNGVDATTFSRINRMEARNHYSIPEQQIVLLYVGRISPEKGLLVLIEALDQIVERRVPSIRLLIAGSGTLGFESQRDAWPELQAYEQRVRQRSNHLPVDFLGNVSRTDLPQLYRAADIFICPSIYEEPFGMVNVEAAAAGLPVIASNVGGIPEAVLHERNGLLVPPNDSNSLAEALIRLIVDKPLAQRLSRTAEKVADEFDWQVLTNQVLTIYDNALDEAPPKLRQYA